jgi:hypothetical protein
MYPMTTFDPAEPCRVHDRLEDRTLGWKTAWAEEYLRHAWLGSDGLVYFDGLILDGWTIA